MNRFFSPSFIDGLLYVLVAMFTSMNNVLGSDDSAKWISPEVLYWCKFIVGSLGGGVLALKMYRSTGYADAKKDKQPEQPKA